MTVGGQDARHLREAIGRRRRHAGRSAAASRTRRPTSRATTSSSPGPSAISPSSRIPEVYDPRYKVWRLDDLPIVPERFEVVPRAEGASATEPAEGDPRALRRGDVERLVNACDAGREGELIFAYILELAAPPERPVERAWFSSHDPQVDSRRVRPPASRGRAAATRGCGSLALRGRLARRRQRDPCSDGQGARARRHGHARPGADADARADGAPRARDRGLRARGVLDRRCGVRARVGQRALPRTLVPRCREQARGRGRGRRDRRARTRPQRARARAAHARAASARAAPVRPHRAPARGRAVARVHRTANAPRGAGVLREGPAHLPAHLEPLPVERSGRRAARDRRARGSCRSRLPRARRVRAGAGTSCRSSGSSTTRR